MGCRLFRSCATNSTVKTAGVRELRQYASELLRRVEAGESIEITDRGRPVAVLVPLPGRGPLQHLRTLGDVTSARAEPADLPAPLPLAPDMPAPSAVLSRLRRDER
jgi:prevent-host-death family protein